MATKVVREHLSRAQSAREGFTLFEVLVVIAIIGLILGLGLFISFDVYRGFSHRSERDTIVSLLERARSHAMANVGQSAWGFCAKGGNYLIFRGASYSGSAFVDESVATSSATVLGLPYCLTSAIVFTQLSGTTTASIPTITIKQGAAPPDTITINAEGTISW